MKTSLFVFLMAMTIIGGHPTRPARGSNPLDQNYSKVTHTRNRCFETEALTIPEQSPTEVEPIFEWKRKTSNLKTI